MSKFRTPPRSKPGLNPFAGQTQMILQQAIALHQKGQLAEAQKIYEAILRTQPKNADALHLMGLTAIQTGQLEEGIAYIDRAIAANPGAASFHSNRGNALMQLRRYQEAIASFDRAIQLKRDFAEAFSNRSTALLRIGRVEDALASSEKALELRPQYPEALNNRGNALRGLKRVDEAIACYDQALALRPHAADTHWNRSLALLSLGRYEEGWREFEWGWENRQRGEKRSFDQPLWLGEEPIAGKTILLWSEQGYGDTIQFARYATEVAKLGARVIFEVPQRLESLMRTLGGVAEVIAEGDPLPTFDLHAPLMSLPLALKATLETIPSPQAYIHPDPQRLERWSQILGPKSKPRIGLAWSGRVDNTSDLQRSVNFETISTLLSDQFEFISLHREVRDSDQSALSAHPQVRHFGDQQQDFADAAALCQLCDVVISVDTSLAHLSAALGKPTWILLSYAPDWRWLLEGQNTAWYPRARLYRQRSPGDWPAVLDRVAADLSQLGV